MTINEVEIRQADNNEVTVGTVSEFDIKITECERECNIDDETRKIKSSWIGGTVVVKVNNYDVKHTFRYLDTIRHKKNGDENKVFKGIVTALGYNVEFNEENKKLVYTRIENADGLIPSIGGKISWVDSNKNVVNVVEIKNGKVFENGKEVRTISTTPTRVKITSRLSLQEGLNSDKTDLAFYNELPISYISTTNVADEDSAVFTVEGVIKDIVNELDSNGGTTGRYIVDLITPNFFGVDVFNLTMLDKWTNVIDGEDVELSKEMFYEPNSSDSFCKIGDTVKLSGDIESHSFGTTQVATKSTKTFGGGAKNMKSGFSRIEWTIKSGEIVEGEEVYDNELMAKALEEREIILDNNFKKRKEEYELSQAQASKPNTASPKGMGGNVANNPFSQASKTNPFASNKPKNPFEK